MKRIYTIILAAAALFAGCEEWQPVFTGEYEYPEYKEPQTMTPTMTIADLKDLYVANGNKLCQIACNNRVEMHNRYRAAAYNAYF